jgi:Zn-dependent protease
MNEKKEYFDNPVPENESALDVSLADQYAENFKNHLNKKGSVLGNITLLLITVIFFFSAEIISTSIDDILNLILVLFIHEIGHFITMKLFRYNNVKMFFVPFIGAAVSGKGKNITQFKKAIVSISGPFFGLIVGIIVLFTEDIYSPVVYKFITMSFILNVFNLLPLFPLDGGRFIQSLIGHNRVMNFIFGLLGTLALITFALYTESWFLAIILLPDFKI